MKYLFTMWTRPRMVAWFLITTGVLLLVRLPFAPMQMMPFYVGFNPGIVLIPLAGVFWGPAGAWGALVSVLIGDHLMGLWSSLTIFRAVGYFLCALTAQQLWYEPLVQWHGVRHHDDSWRSVLRFVIVSIPGSFIVAAWVGLGSEMMGLYPFPYLASVIAIHNVLFTTLLAPAFYALMVKRFYPEWGTWREQLPVRSYSSSGSMRRAMMLWGGALGAYAIGCFAGATFYRIWPLQPYVLGTTCGVWLPVLVIPFVLVHLFGFLHKTSRAKSDIYG